MQVEKRTLISSLDTVRKFIRKTQTVSPIWSCVLIDGQAQKIIAQNPEGRAEVDLKMHDVYKQITVPHEPEFPDEKFFVDLLELDQDQLKNLCDDFGIPYPDGSMFPAPMDMVREIWKASLISADEEGDSRLEWVYEKFCINPIKLGKIVRSLDAKLNELIELGLENYEATNNVLDDESQIPYKIRIGDFQELPVQGANEFPSPVYLDSPPQQFVKVAEFSGKELMHIVNASLDIGDLPYKEMILFDRDNNTIVSCDQKRIHVISQTMAGNSQIKIMTHIVRQLARAGKKISMFYDDHAGVAMFTSGNLSVMTEHVSQKFPSYQNKVNHSFQNTVTTDAVRLERVIKQALLLTGKHYRAVELLFNNGQMSVAVKNPSAGKYLKENIDLKGGSIDPPENFKVDGLWIDHALFPKSGITSWVDISFDSGGNLLKLDQGDCSSVIVTM